MLCDADGSVTVHTGAGISTGSGVPDFRGKNGVWTLRSQGYSAPGASAPLALARPSLAHMALKALVDAGYVRFVVTANVDGLHRRSGLPRSHLAELHGSCFKDKCSECGTIFERDFEVETVGFQCTGRWCTQCYTGPLIDQVLDWESEIPEDDLAEAERCSMECKLSLVLGSSLRIRPASELPALAYKCGNAVSIVNLQRTPKDAKASLVARSRCDYMLSRVIAALGLCLPEYIRRDAIELMYLPKRCFDGSVRLHIHARSVHGPECSVPWLQSICASLCSPADVDDSKAGPAKCHCAVHHANVFETWVDTGHNVDNITSSLNVQIMLHLSELCNEQHVILHQQIDLAQEYCISRHTVETDRYQYTSEEPDASEDADGHSTDNASTRKRKRTRPSNALSSQSHSTHNHSRKRARHVESLKAE